MLKSLKWRGCSCVGEENIFLSLFFRSKWTNKCALALLIACSIKVQRWFYFPLFSQLAVIIFAIWLCSGWNQLSLSDVKFAIIQTRSPAHIYIQVLVIPRLFFQRPSFKKDITSNSNSGQSFFCSAFSSGNFDWTIIWHRALGLLCELCCLSVDYQPSTSTSCCKPCFC